jgi:hypothetical protein
LTPNRKSVSKASNVAVVIKGMKSRDEEQTAEKQWACGGTNPKKALNSRRSWLTRLRTSSNQAIIGSGEVRHMKVKIKITSNNGEEVIFRDMDNGDTGNIKRLDSAATRDEFLSDLAVGTVLEVDRETTHSKRVFRLIVHSVVVAGM